MTELPVDRAPDENRGGEDREPEKAKATSGSLLATLGRITSGWSLRHWMVVGLILEILLLLFIQLVIILWPEGEAMEQPFALTTEMSFVEFQEIQETRPAEVLDLSDKIIEKDKITKEKPINWQNAADPAREIDQRYVARLFVDISPDDYPDRARRANIGRVVVAVRLYIASNGKIRDVKIRNIRSTGDAARPFSAEFKKSVRNILLNKTKLMNAPYSKGGESKDFVWDTVVTFTIQ